jgi:hypothetical protein
VSGACIGCGAELAPKAKQRCPACVRRAQADVPCVDCGVKLPGGYWLRCPACLGRLYEIDRRRRDDEQAALSASALDGRADATQRRPQGGVVPYTQARSARGQLGGEALRSLWEHEEPAATPPEGEHEER